MMKKTIIIIATFLIPLLIIAQGNQETGIKREITLYNPYKPSLPDALKKSFLPDMTDTSRVRPDFKYSVTTQPFMAEYTVSPLAPATMIPDPLSRLYNSYINLGFGNYTTPLAEISITNERSKKGALGVYARHFSTNGKVQLQNLEKVFAGYMDNDVVLFGRKFMRRSIIDGSVDYIQKTRYAYGYDTAFIDYEPDKKEIRLDYHNVGARAGISSLMIDSSRLSYDFDLDYNFFFTGKHQYQHSVGIKGEMAKLFRGFYAGSLAEINLYKPSDSVSVESKYVVALNPYLKKSTSEWNAKLGFRALLDKSLAESARFHIYPDVRFGFNIVSSYVGFFAELTGRLEKNDPLNVIGKNPFLLPDSSIFVMPNTDYSLVVKAGLSGETGIDGNYEISVSYSLVNDYILFSNYIVTDGISVLQRGNYFMPLFDQAEILNLHGETAGKITDKVSFEAGANLYRFTLTDNNYAWNKPGWDSKVGIKYNLRDKIIASAGVNARGARKLIVTSYDLGGLFDSSYIVDIPWNMNFSMSAEYRYTKILSFWLRFNNISFTKQYEWAYYPSQRFLCLVGFTYSL